MTLPPDSRPAKKPSATPAPATVSPGAVPPTRIVSDPLVQPEVDNLLEVVQPGQPVANPFLEAEIGEVLEGTPWRGAVRDDHAVAKAIAEGEELDGVYTLEDAAGLDEFLTFLQQSGLLKHIETLAHRLPICA